MSLIISLNQIPFLQSISPEFGEGLSHNICRNAIVIDAQQMDDFTNESRALTLNKLLNANLPGCWALTLAENRAQIHDGRELAKRGARTNPVTLEQIEKIAWIFILKQRVKGSDKKEIVYKVFPEESLEKIREVLPSSPGDPVTDYKGSYRSAKWLFRQVCSEAMTQEQGVFLSKMCKGYMKHATGSNKPDAFRLLGRFYYYKDLKKIGKPLTLFKKAAELGDPRAMTWLGRMYRDRTTGLASCDHAMYWLDRGVLHNNVKALFFLGVEYMEGNVFPKDPKKAYEFMHEAAIRNFAPAMHNVGWMYYHGKGRPLNYVLASYWFEKAADEGHPNAFYHLGILYEFGCGVKLNRELARQYYEIAKRKGIKEAIYGLERLDESLKSGVSVNVYTDVESDKGIEIL